MDLLYKVLAGIVPVLFAVTLHEVAHGVVANWLGDPTAKQLGRLTVNPIKHIDPLGTILVPIVVYVLSSKLIGQGVPFGWAKPVPVNMQKLGSPQKDMALVALAGPVSNLLMAIFWYGVLLLMQKLDSILFFVFMAKVGVVINLVLMILNLLPIPPLDGGRVVAGVLPPAMAALYGRVEKFGLIIVIFLLLSGILGKILRPFYTVALEIFKI